MVVGMSSCRSTAPAYNYRKLASASVKLGVDIDKKDNHKLYTEAAGWIGVPYRWGGNTKNGTDCSGLTANLYRSVYGINLDRSAEGQRKNDCRKVSKRKLREGDLLFFGKKRSSKKATHVGIYLKDGKFIHASTGKGVIVSRLNEPYYKKQFMAGGRVKK